MALQKAENLIDKGISLLNVKTNEKGVRIYKRLFLDWQTELEVSKYLYPYLYDNETPEMRKIRKERKVKRLWKNEIDRSVSDYMLAFRRLGWLEEKEIQQVKRGKNPKAYRATLKPYFMYLKEKSMEIPDKLKEFVEEEIISYKNTAISLHPGFFESLDRYIKERIHYMMGISYHNLKNVGMGKHTLFRKYTDLAFIYFDNTTLEILDDYITYKTLFTSKDQIIGNKHPTYNFHYKVTERVLQDIKERFERGGKQIELEDKRLAHEMIEKVYGKHNRESIKKYKWWPRGKPKISKYEGILRAKEVDYKKVEYPEQVDMNAQIKRVKDFIKATE